VPLTAVVNARLRPAGVPPPPGPEPTEFHRALPGYRPTPLRELPTIAAELGLASVHVKD
jgi:diaminopropionate ammonia-lyase